MTIYSLKISNSTIFWVINFILISFLLAFYVFQVSVLTQEIYLIKNYEKRFDSLSKENEISEISLSKVNSLSNIKNYFSSEDFVKATRVKYIQILEGSVVTK